MNIYQSLQDLYFFELYTMSMTGKLLLEPWNFEKRNCRGEWTNYPFKFDICYNLRNKYVQFVSFSLCIYRAGYALNANKHQKTDVSDIEKSAHQREDAEGDVYYYNAKASTYDKLTRDTLSLIDEGQLVL